MLALPSIGHAVVEYTQMISNKFCLVLSIIYLQHYLKIIVKQITLLQFVHNFIFFNFKVIFFYIFKTKVLVNVRTWQNATVHVQRNMFMSTGLLIFIKYWL